MILLVLEVQVLTNESQLVNTRHLRIPRCSSMKLVISKNTYMVVMFVG